MVTDSEVTEGRDYTESLSDDRGRAAVRQNDHNDYCFCIVMGQPRQPLHDRMFIHSAHFVFKFFSVGADPGSFY